MKSRIVVLLGLILFSSCIVKSIQPFYIKNSESFNEKLIGSWSDNKKGSWEVLSFEEEFKKEDSKEGNAKFKLTKEDIKLLNKMRALSGNQITVDSHTVPIGQTYKAQVLKALNINT